MENFEYSIQLNDRDWAEFYLASEECSLIQAALATADDPGLSDIEQGDTVPSADCGAGTSKQVTIRVCCTPLPGRGSHPPCGDTREALPSQPVHGHLAPEEVLSGSEDETDLGSVSRFLWESNQPGCPQHAVSMPRAQESQLLSPTGAEAPGADNHVALQLLQPQGIPHEASSQAAEGEGAAALPAAGEEAARRGQAAEAPRDLPRGATHVPEGEQPHIHAGMAKPQQPVHMADLSPLAWVTDTPGGETTSRPLCSESTRWDPHSDMPQSPAADTPVPTCSRASEECLDHGGAWPDAPSSSNSQEVVHLRGPARQGKSHEHLAASVAEATPLLQEPSGTEAQGSLGPTKDGLTPSVPLPETKGEEVVNTPGPGSQEEAGTGRILLHGVARVEMQGLGQGVQRAAQSAVQPAAGLKSVRPRRPAQAAGLEVGESEPSGAVMEREEHVPCPATEDSGESNAPALTWPEIYDYFFCDVEGQERGDYHWGEEGEGMPTASSEQELPVPEMYGPEMYEYFFADPDRSGSSGWESKDEASESARCINWDQASPHDDEGDPGEASGEAPVFSVPEAYEHFFANEAGETKSWKGMSLRASDSKVRKAIGALKSFLGKPVHLVRGWPPDPRAPAERSSQENLPLLPLQLLRRGQVMPEELEKALDLAGKCLILVHMHVPSPCPMPGLGVPLSAHRRVGYTWKQTSQCPAGSCPTTMPSAPCP